MFTMTAREFNQSVALTQRHAETEPVLITRRGDPAFVLLSYEEYKRLSAPVDRRPLSERLAIPPSDDPEADEAADREFQQYLAEARTIGWGRPPVEF